MTADQPAPSPELVALQRRYYQLDARCHEIGTDWPRAVDRAAGLAEPPPGRVAELEQAREERLQVVEQMRAHEWWGEAGDYTEAKERLRAAARGGDTSG